MMTPDVRRDLVAELLNVWNFCGSDREFWREKKKLYPALTEADQMDVIEAADTRWKKADA